MFVVNIININKILCEILFVYSLLITKHTTVTKQTYNLRLEMYNINNKYSLFFTSELKFL